MAPAKETVAFVGIGTMGHAMATNAVRTGFTTTTWNRTRGATEDLAALGAEVADTPADAVGQATIVVTMLSDADVVLAIAREHGMLAAMADGAIWVQMSTIGVEGIEAISALVASQRPDVTLVDAPVSGSRSSRTRRAHPICLGTRAGPCSSRSSLRCARPANGLGRASWCGITTQTRCQRVARLGGRSRHHVTRAGPSARNRNRHRDRGPARQPAGVPMASGQTATNLTG